MKNKSSVDSLKEAQIVLGVGQTILDEMQKKFPKMKFGESYKGKFLPYIIEYINTFIIEDHKDAIKADLEESMGTKLWEEVAFIECFCKWLEEEKGVNLKNDI